MWDATSKRKRGDDDRQQPIVIIKRVKKTGGGHGSSTWKVAYADLMTAMMAFFLMLWLLSVMTDVQKKYIADYFSPTDIRISQDANGSGGILNGTVISPDGDRSDDDRDKSTLEVFASSDDPKKNNQKQDTALDKQAADKQAVLQKQDEKSLKGTAENIYRSIEAQPELKSLMPNLIIDMTPEGLRVQIVDQEGKQMFPLGSTTPLPETVKMISTITDAIKGLPNKIAIRGHTDSTRYGKNATYTNWELSSDRANVCRRIILDSGYDEAKIEEVQGKADREPLDAQNPAAARNRRISIIILKQSQVAGKAGSAPSEPEKHEAPMFNFY